MQRLTGIGVSPGVAIGRAVILIQRLHVLRYHVPADRIPRELARLEESRTRTREQLVDIRRRVERRRGRELAALFDGQVLMLDDPLLLPRAVEIVKEQAVNAEWALQQVFQELGAVFDEMADPYLKERKGDVVDLVGRLRMNLRRALTARDLLRDIEDGSVLIADELPPSFAAQMDWTKVRGFATDAGSRTYHTAILARTLEVPAVVGLHDASRLIQPGQLVALDAGTGELVVDPDADLVSRLERREETPAERPDDSRQEPAVTADGVRILVAANIEFAGDLAAARYASAEGIGLYRSEFLLSAGHPFPTEDEQYETYREMLEGMAPGSVTVRTFDVDDERAFEVPEAGSAGEGGYEPAWAPNRSPAPRLGLRGVRLRLTRPQIFRTQLRALLRAARHGSLRILFPFVSGVEELRDVRRTVGQVASELTREGQVVPRVPVGVMIEVPSAAYAADLLAREADFFTIGTNDLVQYCLAVDRADDRVSRLYEPLNPAIVRLLYMIRRAATRGRIPVSLCGEMASDPALLPLLIGLGLTEFSMTPGAIGIAKRVIAELRTDELRRLARRVLRLSTAAEIEQELLATLGRLTV